MSIDHTKSDSKPGALGDDTLQHPSSDEHLHLENLEERVLYSAVPVPIDLVDFVESPAVGEAVEIVDPFESIARPLDLLAEGFDQILAEDAATMDLSGSGLQANDVGQEEFELIIIDESVDGYEDLLEDILIRNDSEIHYEIKFIESDSDGLGQLNRLFSEQVSEEKEYQAIHLVTHGSDATLNLGSTEVNFGNIHAYASQFIGWQDVLSADADLLIYGCEVAETRQGEQFVQELADLTGADVAASDDITGHFQLGGDWQMEVFVGQVETDVVFSHELQASWMSSLALGDREVTSESGNATGQNLAINDDQTIVQVFSEENSSGDFDVYYQLTNQLGTHNPVLVNSTSDPAGDQHWASVAIDNDGDFVVTWTNEDGGSQGVYAKYFAADGSVIRDEFRVDVGAGLSGGNDASVAMDATGNFVVAWEGSGTQDSDGIYAKRFDETGNEIGPAFLVNDTSNAGLNQGNVDVDMNDSGQFVFVWDTFLDEYTESQIYVRWFDSDGTAADTTETLVDGDLTQLYHDASVSINATGNFVVVYTSDTDRDIKEGGGIAAALANNLASGVVAKTYTSDGSSLTHMDTVLAVSQTVSGEQHSPTVTLLDNNEFIVTWEGRGTADNGAGDYTDEDGTFYETFDFDGNRLNPDGEAFVDPGGTVGTQGDVSVTGNGTEFVFSQDNNGDVLSLQKSFNYAPISDDSTLTIPIGFEYTLQLSDVSYSDSEGDELEHVVIDSLPNSSQGVLRLNGVVVNVGDVISRTEIESGDLTIAAASTSIGSIGSVEFRSFDGNSYSDAATISLSAEFSDALFIGTRGSQTLGGVTWDQQDIVALGGSDLALGPASDADVFAVFNAGFDLDAFHFVSRNTSIPLATPVSLEHGDVLFSVEGTANVPGIGNTQNGDILLFKPGSPGDYDINNGTFSVLLNSTYNDDVKSLTLVESNTMVGDFEVQAGDILFTADGDADKIYRLSYSGGVADGEIFIDGADLGIGKEIFGLELIEDDVSVGGVDLSAGTILFSIEGNDTVDGTNVQDNDIATMLLTSTNLGPSNNSSGAVDVLFDASSVAGLSGGGDGDVTAISIMLPSEAEQIENNNTVSLNEGTAVTISNTLLSVTDSDNPANELEFSVNNGPANGTLFVSGLASTTFTQDDINNNRVTYQHDGSETTSDVISLTVNDGFGVGTDLTLNFDVEPVNDAPNVVVNAVAVSEGSTGNVITTSNLGATDVDPGDTAQQLTYEVTDLPDFGEILLSGSTLVLGDTFTQQDVIDGLVSYNHNGAENSTDQILLSLSDGLEDGVAAQSVVLNLDVALQNDPISDLNSGFEINTTGEDTYFIADDGDTLFGNATELTYEVIVSVENPDTYITLASYRTPSDTSVGDDAFRITIDDTGQLSIVLNGNEENSTATDYRALLTDGSPHSFAITWQSDVGHWEVIVDGQIVDQGNGLSTGESIRSGGTFVFGQEQDSIDGGYAQNNAFKGHVYDVRIWDSAQSVAEIAQNQYEQFSPDNIPSGLVSNWQFNQLASGDKVVDLVSGNDLSLQRVAGFETAEVLTTLNINENSANGAVVGSVIPTDAEFFQDLVMDGSFTQADDPTGGGAFDFREYSAGEYVGDWEVVNNSVDLRGDSWQDSPLGGRALDLTGSAGRGTIAQTLQTVVGQTYSLTFALSGNFEGSGPTAHSVEVNVDGATSSFTFNEPSDWSRSNLQWESRTLTFTATSTSTVLQFESTSGTNRGAIVSDITVTDDPAPISGQLTFGLVDDAGGRFTIDGNTGQISVANGTLLDHEANDSHTIRVLVEDEDSQIFEQDVVVQINDVAEAATIVQTNLSVNEGSSGNIISATQLDAVDQDTNNDQLIYTVQTVPSNGILNIDGTPAAVNDTFTQDDIENGRITYDHNGSETLEDAIELALDSGAVNQSVEFRIDVIGVNDAPEIAGGSFLLPDVLENSSNPTGTSIRALLYSNASNVSDNDSSAVQGIAVVGVDNNNGQWQYSLDNGVNWLSMAVSGVSTTGTDDLNGLVLNSDAMVRFVPASDYTGTAGDLSFRLWDQTDGLSNGMVADVSYSGPADSVSTDVATVTLDVDSSSGFSNLVPINQTTSYEQPIVFSGANGNAITVSDSDPGTDAIVRITLEVKDGVLNLNPAATGGLIISPTDVDGSSKIIFLGTESQVNAAMDGLTFTPDTGFSGASTLGVTSDFDYGLLAEFTDPGPGVDPSLVANDPERGTVAELETNEFIEILNGNDPTEFGQPPNITLAGWVNLKAGSVDDEFISVSDSVVLRLDAAGQGNNVTAFFYDGANYNHTTATFGISGTGWHHLAYTFDSVKNEQVLYIDGVAVASTNYTQDIQYQNIGTFIGLNPKDNSHFLDGRVDDVLLYNRVITSTEVQALFTENHSDQDTFSIFVEPNDAPVAVDNNLGIFAAGAPVSFSVTDLLNNDTDSENDALSVSSFTQPGNGSLVLGAGGDFVFTPDPGFAGPLSFEYTITDGTSNESTATVSFTINDVPIGIEDEFSGVQDTAVGGDLADNDYVGLFQTTVTYSLVDNVDNGTISLTADGVFVYIPNAGFYGTDEFTYVIDDGFNQSTITSASVTVLAPPIAFDDHVAVNAGAGITINMLTNDVDPDGAVSDLTAQIVDAADHGLVASSLPIQSFTYSTNTTTATTDQIVYQITDPDGLISSTATIHITINHAPDNIVIGNDRVDENAAVGTVIGTVSATDLNDDIVSFELVDNDGDATNDLFEIDSDNGELSVKNSQLLNFEASSTVEQQVRVIDAAGLQTLQKFTIHIDPVDESPVAPDSVRSLDEGGVVRGNLRDVVFDAESDIESFSLLSGTANGELTFNSNGTWVYAHDDTENFVDSFTYEVVDSAGNQSIATVNLNIEAIADTPVANADAFNVDAANELDIRTVDLLDNDENIKNSPTIEIVTNPQHGSLEISANGNVKYKPALSFIGVDSFEYRVTVDDQSSETASVLLNVNGVFVDSRTEATEPSIVEGDVDTEQPLVTTGPAPDSDDDDDEKELIPIPLIVDRTSVLTGNGGSNGDSEEGFLIEESEDVEEDVSVDKRQLLWQPRYAELGEQFFANARLSNGNHTVSELESSLEIERLLGLSLGLSGEFSSQLDEQIQLPLEFSEIPLLSFSATSFVTVGYLVWAVRAGALVSTFISVPAWTQFDPLPVIEKGIPVNLADEDDSLEKLVDTA